MKYNFIIMVTISQVIINFILFLYIFLCDNYKIFIRIIIKKIYWIIKIIIFKFDYKNHITYINLLQYHKHIT